jgi:hypothetical protein
MIKISRLSKQTQQIIILEIYKNELYYTWVGSGENHLVKIPHLFSDADISS